MDQPPKKKRKHAISSDDNAAASADGSDDAHHEEDGPIAVDSLDETVDLPKFAREHQHTLAFPDKLMLMLIHIGRECRKAGRNLEEECIGWEPDGKAIVVRDQKALCETWLPLFFGQAKYSSFTRKLYRWEFRKLNMASEVSPPSWVYFRNDNFQRDRVDLRRNMKSVTAIKLRNEAAAARSVQNEAGQSSSLPWGVFGDRFDESGVGNAAHLPIAADSARSFQAAPDTASGFPWNTTPQSAIHQQPINFGVPPETSSNLSASDITSLPAFLSLLASQQNLAQRGDSTPAAISNTPQHSISISTLRGDHQQNLQGMNSSGQSTAHRHFGTGATTGSQASLPASLVQGPVDTTQIQNPAANIVQLMLLQQLQSRQSNSMVAPVQDLSVSNVATVTAQSQLTYVFQHTVQVNLLALLNQLGISAADGSTTATQPRQPRQVAVAQPTQVAAAQPTQGAAAQPTQGAAAQPTSPAPMSQETILYILNLLAQLNSGQSSAQSNNEGRR